MSDALSAGHDGHASDAAELVDGAIAADDGLILDFHVAGQQRAVDQRHAVADLAIVSDVAVGHQEIPVADGGRPLLGGPVDRDSFADDVVLTDQGPLPVGRRVEFTVLRVQSNAGIGIDQIVGPDGQRPLKPDAANQARSASDSDMALNRAARADDHVVSQLGFGIDNTGRMDISHRRFFQRGFGCVKRTAHMIIRRSMISDTPEVGFPSDDTDLSVMDLGRTAYAPAWEIQRQTHERVLAGQAGPTLILVEHDPVITVSQRPSARQHLTASPALLARLGIDVQPTDRGGDITYHGPGQLVAYPILRLADYGLMVGGYMRLLEQAVIDLLAGHAIPAGRESDFTGVWTPLPGGDDSAGLPCFGKPTAKICAMGVRVRRNVTLHGLALNVTTDLSHFQTIVPCGLVGKSVTSMQQWLGDRTPTMPQVKQDLVRLMRHHLKSRSASQRSRQAPST